VKSAIQKLFDSPAGNGFFDSPAFFFGLGAGLVIFAAYGAVTGQFVTGRTFVIAYAAKPGFFLFMLIAILALGAVALVRGYRRWRAHGE
jgi:hypothetical protein